MTDSHRSPSQLDDSSEPAAGAGGDSRRRFMKKALVGGAVAWVAPTVLTVQPAAAVSCVEEEFDWAAFLDATTVGELNLGHTVTADIGSLSHMSVTLSAAGMTSGGTAKIPTTPLNPLGGHPTGGGDPYSNFLQINMDSKANGEFCELRLQFTGTVNTAVHNMQFLLLDVDRSAQPGALEPPPFPVPLWQDQVRMTATLGGSPVLASSVTPTVYPVATSSGTSNTVTGQFDTANPPDRHTPNGSTDSNATVVYTTYLNQIVFRYTALDGDQLQQIGISSMTFCVRE